MQRENFVYTLMVNVTVLMAVAGLVLLIANNLTSIPANIYIGVFATLAVVLIGAGIVSQRRGQIHAVQALSFYAGIVVGLVIFAGGYYTGIATFVPDLLLIWMAALILLALLFTATWQMGLVALLNLAWLAMAFLYGLAYWPGLIIIGCLYWFAWQQRTSTTLFLLAVLNSMVIINFYGYDLIHPAHYPLTYATVHLLVTFAFFGMLSGLAGITWRNIPPWSPWLRYSKALIWLSTVMGIGLLLYLITPGSWTVINQNYDGGLFAIVLGMMLYMVTAVFVFSRPTMPGTRSRFLLWTIGFMLLVSGLNKMVMPFAFQQYMTLVLGLLAMGIGLGLIWSALQLRSRLRLLLGLFTLATATTLVMNDWVHDYVTASTIFLLLAFIMMLFTLRLRHKANVVVSKPTVPIAGRRVTEVGA